MKILHLTDLFEPSIGGMELHVLDLIRERRRRGTDVVVVTLTKAGTERSLAEQDGIRVIRISGGFSRAHWLWRDPQRPFHPPFPDPIVSRHLREIVTRERPDAIHAHNWMVYSYLAIKRDDDPPVLWMQHDYSLACPKKSAWYYKDESVCLGPSTAKCLGCGGAQYGVTKGTGVTVGLELSNALLVHKVDRFVANSRSVLEFARHVLPSERKVRVVPGFVAAELDVLARSVRRPSYLPDQDGYLLFVGSTGVYKGIYDLLAAYRELRKPAPPLVVLGVSRHDSPTDWPADSVVRNLVPYEEIMSAMLHCSMVVVPSRWPEPFGRIVLEAGSVGKPVVASDVGGLRDLARDSGLLVAASHPSELAGAIQQLLDDPAEAAALGEAGRATARAYTLERMTERLDAEVASMVEEHQARVSARTHAAATP
jgi:glycosyltransferase involved in cell wall biosynthesis